MAAYQPPVMKQTLLLFFSFFLLISCSNKQDKFSDKTYIEAKESLADKERNNPLNFLSVHGDDKKHLLGKTVVKGIITNTASITAYKDVRIKMQCFSNNKQVEEHEDVIKEIIQPNSSADFKTRYRLPKNTDSIALSLMSAVYSDGKPKK